MTFSGVVGGSGGFSLTGSSAGKLILANANTYAGATFVNSGTLNLRHPLSLGPGDGTVAVRNGAALELELAEANTINRFLDLGGSDLEGSAALRNLSGVNEWSGPIRL